MKNLKDFITESNTDLEEMIDDLSEWWGDHINSNGYENNREFRKDMEAMAKGLNDPLVDSAFYALSGEYGWSEHEVDKNADDLIEVLTQWAQDKLEIL